VANIDLRKSKGSSAPPPSAAQVDEEARFMDNQLPLPMGSEISLSAEMKTFFEKLGWQEGDPIPNLSTVIDEIQNEHAKVLEESGEEESRPLRADKIIDFDDLSDDEKERLIGIVAGAKAQYEQLQNAEASPDVSDSVATAINEANAFEVVDDPAQEAEDTSVDIVDDPDAADDISGVDIQDCPHCGWDITKHDSIDVDESDKYAFLASVLGGKRYFKDADLFDGSVVARFQTLTTDEADLALAQCAYDYRDRKVTDQGEFFRVLSNYRMCLGLNRIHTQGSVTLVPPLDEITWDEPGEGQDPQTVLPVLLEYVNANVLQHETMRRVVGMSYQRFQRAVEKMEANVDNSDFWKVTGSVP
jgi:hypothetical protein